MYLSYNMKINNYFNVIKFVIFVESLNILYFYLFFSKNNYLPSPFVWDKSDTFMDFYNPLFWVIKDGFYTSYNSIYPGLNYYFLKILGLGVDSSLVATPFELRDSFPMLSAALVLVNLLIVFIASSIGEWRKVAPNKLLIFIAIVLSTPVLFSIERGNLVFWALLFLALYLNSKSPWARAIFFGLLVNVKPYFMALLILDSNFYKFNGPAIFRNVTCALVLFFGLGWFAGINFSKYFSTYLSFSSAGVISMDGYLAMPNSLVSLIYIKRTFVDTSRLASSYQFWVSTLNVLAISGPLILIFISLFKRLSKNELRMSALIFIANFSPSTGGYVYLFYILIIPYFLDLDDYRSLLIILLMIFSMPFDWFNIINFSFEIPRPSYFGGGAPLNNINVWISLSSILRPLFNFLLMSIFTFKLIRKYGFFNLSAISMKIKT